MRRRMLGLLALLVAGCGPGEPDAGEPDAGEPDAGEAPDAGPDASRPADEAPPELRDVVAALASPPITFDLSAGGARRVIFSPSTIEFRVFASDDVSAAEDLTVTLVNPNDRSVYAAERTFERGLWELTHPAEPGFAFAVMAQDEAGNAVLLGNVLTFPSLTEGLARTWTALAYDASLELAAQRPQAWGEGQLCHVDEAGRGGTYRVEDGPTLIVEERHTSPCGSDPGAEAETVERTVRSALYVDDVYLATGRFEREGDEIGAEGVWTREQTVTEAGASRVVAETLTLSADGTYAWTRDEGGAASSVSGTYEVADNPDYTFDYGDFLVLTTDTRDGVSLPEPETEVRWFVLRGGYLLLEPLVDLES